MNPFEESGRRAKASGLLVQCLRDGLTAAEAAGLTATEWAALAGRAGRNPPSETTRAMVVEGLERREAPADADPFAGLGR